MLPQYNKELTRKIVALQEMMPFLNLHISPERMLRRMDSEKIDLRHHADDHGLSGATSQHFAAGHDSGVYAVRSAPRALSCVSR